MCQRVFKGEIHLRMFVHCTKVSKIGTFVLAFIVYPASSNEIGCIHVYIIYYVLTILLFTHTCTYMYSTCTHVYVQYHISLFFDISVYSYLFFLIRWKWRWWYWSTSCTQAEICWRWTDRRHSNGGSKYSIELSSWLNVKFITTGSWDDWKSRWIKGPLS